MESKCQLYTVSKVEIAESKWEYVAWFARPKSPALLLGIETTPEAAKTLCASHGSSM
jgi:hypothetical protein